MVPARPFVSRRPADLVALALAFWLVGGGAAMASVPDPTDKLWTALEQAEKRSAAKDGLAPILAAAGKTPDKLLKWVGASVRHVPYAGLLQGAEGTARSRRGNALDQALLLQALLTKAGHRGAEIVQGALPSTHRAGLAKAFGASDGAAPLADRKRLGAAAASATGASGATVKALGGNGADAKLVAKAVAAGTKAAPALSAWLGRQLRPARHAPPSTHFWVRLDGKDLDPLGLAKHSAKSKVIDAARINRMAHTVTLEVMLKRKRGKRSEEVPLLRVTDQVAHLAWAPIEVALYPDPTKVSLAKAGKSATKMAAALRSAKLLRTAAVLGTRRIGGAAFDRQGQRHKVGSDGKAGGPEALGGSLGSMGGGLGGALGGGRPKAAKGKPSFESVILRVRLRGPQQLRHPESVQERVLLSAGDKEALPAMRVSLLVAPHALEPGARERSTVRALLDAKPAYEALVKGEPTAARVGAPREPSALLMRMADLRRRVQHGLLAQKGGKVRALRERPGVLALVERLALTGKKQLVTRRSIDIMSNSVGYLAADGRADAALGLASGVADTVLEAGLIGDAGAATSAWARLAKPTTASAAPTIKRERGMLVVSWSDKAWWAIAPNTGNVVGRVPGGGGQASVEYSWQVAKDTCAWSYVTSVYSTADGGNTSAEVDKWVGRFCAVITGTTAQQASMEHIAQIRDALWKIALDALVDLPE